MSTNVLEVKDGDKIVRFEREELSDSSAVSHPKQYQEK